MPDQAGALRVADRVILRRLPDSRFSVVERKWEGETAVILGGGPSLTFLQIEKVHTAHLAGKVRCIAVNDTYLWAPWADVSYFADAQFWGWHSAGIDKPLLGLRAEHVRKRFAAFAGEKCSIGVVGNRLEDIKIEDEAVHVLKNNRTTYQELSLDPQYLATAQGKNGGFQALNLAVLAGAKEIILLGFDGKPGHFHGGHPKPTPDHFYDAMRKGFSCAENAIKEAGIRVLNCSPGSALDNFPKMAIEEALA
jgi:hypothetical protein